MTVNETFVIVEENCEFKVLGANQEVLFSSKHRMDAEEFIEEQKSLSDAAAWMIMSESDDSDIFETEADLYKDEDDLYEDEDGGYHHGFDI